MLAFHLQVAMCVATVQKAQPNDGRSQELGSCFRCCNYRVDGGTLGLPRSLHEPAGNVNLLTACAFMIYFVVSKTVGTGKFGGIRCRGSEPLTCLYLGLFFIFIYCRDHNYASKNA